MVSDGPSMLSKRVAAYCEQLRVNLTSLLKLFWCSQISVASFTKWSLQPVILITTVMSWKLIRNSALMLCSLNSDFLVGICCTWVLHHVLMVWVTCPMYTLLRSQDTVYSWSLKVRVIFHWSQQVEVLYPEDRGSRFLKNSGTNLPDYMASPPRKL